MTQTFIPGKDAALEDTLSRFQQTLTALGFNVEEASWLNPVPHVWSVHVRDKSCPLCFANGKGATQKAALASALGEFLERLSTNYFFADFWLGKTVAEAPFVHYPDEKWFPVPDDNALPEGLLDPALRRFYDPDGTLRASDLIDLQSGNLARGICALPFIRQSDQQTIWIPMNIIGNLYVSNGMSAGNTRREAHVQALSEVFERYVKNRIISEAISLPEIPQNVLQRYPAVTEAMQRLEKEGFPVFAYDGSLGGQYPVICVVLFNPHNSTCFASFGAHPNFGVALERTVTELLQGRSLQDLDVFSSPTFDNAAVAEQTNLETHFIDSSGLVSWDLFRREADYPFVDWNFAGATTEEEMATLSAICQAHGREIYLADYTHLGINACRILVPGMSDIYPPEDLQLANNNMAMGLRPLLMQLPARQLERDRYLALIDELEEEGYDDFTRVRELLGLATGANNAWYTLRIGELKAMLALAGGDHEQALEWIDWTLEFNASLFSEARMRYYRCLQALLILHSDPQKEVEAYWPAFCRMYGQQTVEAASAALAGKAPFYDLFPVDDTLAALPMHQCLLEAYQKLQQAKARAWGVPA